MHVVDEVETTGSVAVYGKYFQEKSKQKCMLIALLVASVVSIILAVIGEFR